MIAESLICLALNVYHEAKNQSFIGQVAVAQVVMNRVEDSRYPNNVCDVVKQGLTYKWKPTLPIKNRCQFSWYCDGEADVIWANYNNGKLIEMNAKAWRDSVQVAIWTMGVGNITIEDNTKGAVYYYAHNLVYPSWADSKQYIGVLGNHTFMK